MLLPQELRNYSFSHAIRGYTTAEVEEYIEFLIGKYEEVYRENHELEHKLSIAMQSLDTLRAREAKITALDAEMKKAAARLLAESEQKQQQILADAENKRKQIIDDASEYADRIVAEADAHVTAQEKRFAELQKEVETLRNTLFAAYSSHIDQVESLVNAVLTENFSDPVAPAADLAEIAEEVATPPECAKTAETPDEDLVPIEESEEISETAENAEDVYTEEELQEEEPSPEEEYTEAPAAIFLPDDYDEDVYSDAELYEEDDFAKSENTFAEPEVFEEPETFDEPETFAQPDIFEEPAAFSEPEIFEDAEIEAFEEILDEEEIESFEEIRNENAPTEFLADDTENIDAEEDDARLLQELHEAFDKSFAALKADDAAADAEEDTVNTPTKTADVYDAEAEEDEWLAALKKLENVVSSPTKKPSKADADDFTFLEEEEVVDTGRRGLFGKKKPKDR